MVILANIYQCGVFIYSRAGFWSDSRQPLPRDYFPLARHPPTIADWTPPNLTGLVDEE